MGQIKASFIFQTAASFFAIVGILLITLGVINWSEISFAKFILNTNLVVLGIVLLLISIVGPVRIILIGVQIPLEIKQNILLLAICIPISGATLVLVGLYNLPWTNAFALLICGFCALIIAYGGFYRLSKRLPDQFYIGEMLRILKSSGVIGKKENSMANEEFMRWSNGIRDGVKVGELAPDGQVISQEGETLQLSTFFTPGTSFSPLVLNFCSYSCPHYRKRISELHVLMDKWEKQGVRFLTIYTAEAHPEDGWSLVKQYEQDQEYTGDENDFCFYYAKTLNDRQRMANWLIEKKNFKMPVVLDTMENNLLSVYNSWPIRLYVIHDKKIAYSGQQGPFGYTPEKVDVTLRNLLENWIKKNS